MWLLAGRKAPDHSTIARFRTGFLADTCEAMFYQMVRRLERMGELSKETGWKMGRKDVPENTGGDPPIEPRVPTVFPCIEETRTQDIQKICCFIEQVCEEQHTVLVHGRGRRKSRNQRYLELFRRFLERQTVYDWHTDSFQGQIRTLRLCT